MALSFSLHIVCSCEVPAANHRRGDSFGGQCRYEPSPNSLIMYPRNPTQKAELKWLRQNYGMAEKLYLKRINESK